MEMTPDKVEALYNDYMCGEFESTELCGKYGLSVEPTRIYTLFPPVITETNCPYCSQPMYQRRKSRTGTMPKPLFCTSCEHKEKISCTCIGCLRARKTKAREVKKARSVSQIYDPAAFFSVPYEDLSVSERMLLLSLIQSTAVKETGDVEPMVCWGYPSPWGGGELRVLRNFAERQILIVSKNTPTAVFGGGDGTKASLTHCNWKFNISFKSRRLGFTELRNKLRYDLVENRLSSSQMAELAEGVAVLFAENAIESVMKDYVDSYVVDVRVRRQVVLRASTLPIGLVCGAAREAALSVVGRSNLSEGKIDAVSRQIMAVLIGDRTFTGVSSYYPLSVPILARTYVEQVLNISIDTYLNSTIAQIKGI